jgi:hypothetical protein
LTAPTDVLEVGSTLALQAQVTDAEGDPIPASRITWSSGSPDLASVDASGVVMAKQLGLEFIRNPTVSIKATIDNHLSTSKEVLLKLYGFRVTGGTFNTGAATLGTSAKVSYVSPTGNEPATEFSYTVYFVFTRMARVQNGILHLSFTYPSSFQRVPVAVSSSAMPKLLRRSRKPSDLANSRFWR